MSGIIRRTELAEACLELGDTAIDLSGYATTGLRIVAVGPSGSGKTNAGLVIAEQLSSQGWVSVLVDPEGELGPLYGGAVSSPEALSEHLALRDRPVLVVEAASGEAFEPYGRALLAAADEHRKPIFLMIDEGQLFSSSRRKRDDMGASSQLVNDFVERGRKRALDLFVTAQGFSSSLDRAIYRSKNLTLIGNQSDPAAWSSLAPQFKGTGIGFSELMALAPGEFFCFSRSGVEKVSLTLAGALAPVAMRAKPVRPVRPATFSQWDAAMREIPTERLRQLTPEVVDFLATVAGLSQPQLLNGSRALSDELAAR